MAFSQRKIHEIFVHFIRARDYTETMKKKKKKQKGLRFLYASMAVFVAMLVCVLVLLVLNAKGGKSVRTVEVPVTPEPTATPTPRPTRSPIPVDVDYTAVHDTRVKVYIKETGELKEMYMEEYLIGVVAAEVPAAYRIEAIKAQAVAARCYTVRKLRHDGCATHPEANICTDSSCCQAYATEEEREAQWPEEYPYYFSVICKAVMETAGECMLVGGRPIDAMYHASSGGWTEDSENVYKNKYNYLRSVESPYEDDKYQNVTVTFTRREFTEKINAAYPDAKLTEKGLENEVQIESTFPSGRVESMRLGGTKQPGTKIKKTLKLYSALFTFEITDDEVIFHTKGYGHGVGMSQSGANGMAKQGATYRQILSHYYTGVKFGIIGRDFNIYDD